MAEHPNQAGQVPSADVIKTTVDKEPKSRNDSFYSDSPSKKSGVIKTSVDQVV